jgi:hypothetical protein
LVVAAVATLAAAAVAAVGLRSGAGAVAASAVVPPRVEGVDSRP